MESREFPHSDQIQEPFISPSASSFITETVLNTTVIIGVCTGYAPGGGTMKKRSIAWAGLLLGLLLPFMAACGGGLLQKSGNSDLATRPAGGQLYVLDNYTGTGNKQAAQHIVALPAGTTNPTIRLMLPAGLTDLKHQRLYVAYSMPGGSTSISVIDTNSGATMRTFSIMGSYSTADRGNADSMLSRDGRWLGLRGPNK